MNPRRKGTLKEGECLTAFSKWLKSRKETSVLEIWRSHPQRYQSQDLFSAFDLAIAVRYKSMILCHFIQVKSTFSPKYYTEMRHKWGDSINHVWYATYGARRPILHDEMGAHNLPFRIDGFWFIRVA